MEQHAIPRQITSFEFKLIGFMTLRQFIYLVVFIPIGFIVYFLFPIPVLNLIFGFCVGCLGLLFAFFPIYDRPLDVWVKNLYKRLMKPTQFLYKKSNKPIYFLNDLYFVSDPHRTSAHVESQEKLNAYLSATNNKILQANQTSQQKQKINTLFQQKIITNKVESKAQPVVVQAQANLKAPPVAAAQGTAKKNPFFTGVVKNHKYIALPGILIYVKNSNNQMLRLLKTNPHGVFATFNALPVGEYTFEIKDPNNNYFFDTIKIRIEAANQKPVEIFSKEMI